MLFTIRHQTHYRYTAPVRESVMELWVQPRQSETQRLLRFAIELDPPAQLFSYADAFRNAVYHFDVPQPHQSLTIVSTADVETSAPPPLPAKLDDQEWGRLQRESASGEWFEFLQPHGYTMPTARLEGFLASHGMATPIGADPLTAMLALSTRLSEALDYEPGVTRADSPIDDALSAGRGVCQDFAHIMIAAARHWGIPARYVSGYLFTDRDAGDRTDSDATHAWIEVMLPSLGWVGLDPTNNHFVGERHIVVAIGRDYGDVPPSRGVYKGETDSELTVAVSIRRADGAAPDPEFMRTPRQVQSKAASRVPSAASFEQFFQQQ